MALQRRVNLPNASGISIPQIHLGLYLTTGDDVKNAVTYALEAGYRAFDSAQDYENEAATSAAINSFLSSSLNQQGLKRSDITYTSKLKDNGTLEAVRRSVKTSTSVAPGGYIDLFLLHAPFGGNDVRVESWRALESAVDDGEVKAIGVSNFGVRHMEELVASKPRFLPAVNQIEVHPFNTRTAIREVCRRHNIVVQAYSPLVHGLRMEDPTIRSLAERYTCTPGQLLLKWSLQHGMVPLPKSVKKARIIENGNVDGEEICKEDLDVLDKLDEQLCTDWDPTNAE